MSEYYCVICIHSFFWYKKKNIVEQYRFDIKTFTPNKDKLTFTVF